MKLYWLDLETTGLDPAKSEILEVAVLEADISDPFNVRLLINEPVFTAIQDADLDPFIVDMHTKNGLLEACRRTQSRDCWEIEDALLDLIPDVPKDERGTLAGSSIHFDHGFIRYHMPRLAKRLSHRHYDVSSVMLFCESLGMPAIPREPAHRALSDIQASIRYAKKCRAWLDPCDTGFGS